MAKVYQGYWHVFFPLNQNMGIFHESDKFKVIRFIDTDYYYSGTFAGAMMNHTPHLFLFAQNNTKLCDYSDFEVIRHCSNLYSTFSAP